MKRCYFLLVLFTIASCNTEKKKQVELVEQEQIIIEGWIEDGDHVLVTLDRMDPNAFVSIDSIRCDKNGKFKIVFASDVLNYYALKYTEEGYVTIIAEPGETIELKGNAESLYPYEIIGSKSSFLVHELASRHKVVLDELQEISIKSEEILGNLDFSSQKMELNLRFDSITTDFHSYSKEFIYSNPGSPAILIALYNQFGPGLPVFHPMDDFPIYRFADSALHANYQENAAVRALHSQMTSALQQIKNAEQKEVLNKGMRAPDFVLPSSNGSMIALSDYKNNYILLQIWASWSQPSLVENAWMNRSATEFGTQGLKILQVSIDDNRQEWLAAIQDMNKDILQVSDLQRWESSIVSLYQLERIPANFLINPEGIIVEKDIFAEELAPMLERYLVK